MSGTPCGARGNRQQEIGNSPRVTRYFQYDPTPRFNATFLSEKRGVGGESLLDFRF